MENQTLSALHHCVFSLHYHLVPTTNDRRKIISKPMLERLQEIFAETLRKWDCKLIEFNGEKDHVHLLFKTTPNLQMSVLINNLKTVSSRLIRKEGIAQIRQGAHEKCHDSVRHFCRFFRADFGLSLPK